MILLRVQAALIETSALGDVELKQFTDKAFEKVATKLNDEQ
jgi:hypothetical protein